MASVAMIAAVAVDKVTGAVLCYGLSLRVGACLFGIA